MGDGSWKLGDGRWEMGVGRWEMGVGRWEMEVGRWKLGVLVICALFVFSKISHLVSNNQMVLFFH